jgi:hypothetical protein
MWLEDAADRLEVAGDLLGALADARGIGSPPLRALLPQLSGRIHALARRVGIQRELGPLARTEFLRALVELSRTLRSAAGLSTGERMSVASTVEEVSTEVRTLVIELTLFADCGPSSAEVPSAIDTGETP